MNDTPWTPGEWVIDKRKNHPRFIDAVGPIKPLVMDYGGDWTLDISDADAELIALAPEMAEAILEMENAREKGDQNLVALAIDMQAAVAEKLRAMKEATNE